MSVGFKMGRGSNWIEIRAHCGHEGMDMILRSTLAGK